MVGTRDDEIMQNFRLILGENKRRLGLSERSRLIVYRRVIARLVVLINFFRFLFR